MYQPIPPPPAAPHVAYAPAPFVYIPRGMVDAAGARVRTRRPWPLALWTLLTLGIYGAIWHMQANEDLRDYGRARGDMPFPYIEVTPGWSLVAALGGGLLALNMWATLLMLLFGDWGWTLQHVMGFASSVTGTLPLVATAYATAQRMRVACLLAGIESRLPRPTVAGALAALCFPLWVMSGQRTLNRVWGMYPSITPTVTTLSQLGGAIQPLHGVGVASPPSQPAAPIAMVQVIPNLQPAAPPQPLPAQPPRLPPSPPAMGGSDGS